MIKENFDPQKFQNWWKMNLGFSHNTKVESKQFKNKTTYNWNYCQRPILNEKSKKIQIDHKMIVTTR